MVKRAGTALLVIALLVIAALTVAGIAPATAASRHRHRHRPPSSGVRGVVTAGPVCPVVMLPPDPTCDDVPVPAKLTLQRGDAGAVVARGVAGDDGMFLIRVAPGSYTLSASSPNAMRCFPTPVTVSAGRITDVQVSCDTGIR